MLKSINKAHSSLLGLIMLISIIGNLDAATINIGPNGCSLKDAIKSANANAPRGNCSAGSGSDIIIAPDDWLVTIDDTLPTITSNITFQSASTGGSFLISGDDDHQIMKVTGNNTVTFNRVHLINAKSNFFSGPGGALNVMNATVNLNDSLIGSSFIADASGSAIAIYNGVLNINQSTLRNNDIESTGAPAIWIASTVYAVNSEVSIIESTFKNNHNSGIYMNGGELTVANSLFNEERSGIAGKQTVVNIENSTFNPANAIEFYALSLTDGSFVGLNHNTIIGRTRINDSILNISNSIYGECFLDNTSINLNTHNMRLFGGTNPLFNCLPNNGLISGIGPLADNGGPTETRALSFNSSAINAGDINHCLALDQRGEDRIGVCDVGAFEVTAIADVSTEIVFSQPEPYAGSQDVSVFMRVINNGPGDASNIEVDIDTEQLFVQGIDSTQCDTFPCVLDFLAAGQQAYIPVEMAVGSPFNSPMSLTMESRSTPASTHEDPVEANNLTSVTFDINEGADTSVTMSLVTPPPYFTGQTVTYRANLFNAGQSTASQVMFNFQGFGLNNISYMGCDTTPNQNCVINGILNGSNEIIDITAQITQGQFNAIGTVSSEQVDINLLNNIDDQQNNGAISNADIKISMELNQSAPFYSSQYLAFDISITALDDATNIQLWTEFPGAEYIDLGFCNGTFPCMIPSIAAGTTMDLTFQMFAPVLNPGVIDNISHRVFATPGQYDPNLSDNEVIITETLQAASDTAVTLDLVSEPPFYVGQEVEYDLTVYNNGPNDITDVNITDTTENLTLSWADGQSCQTLHCSISEIDLFQNENMTLVYKINQEGAFNLTVNAQSNEIDEFPNNNSDSSNNGGIATLPSNDLIFKNEFE